MFAMVIYVGQMSGGGQMLGQGPPRIPDTSSVPIRGSSRPSVGRRTGSGGRRTLIACPADGRNDQRAAPLLTRPRPRSRGRRIPFPAGSHHIGLQSRRVDVIYENR